MRKKILCLICVSLFIFSIQSSGITVDELIEKNIKARGGYKNLESVRSLKVNGKYMARNIEANVILMSKRPNMIRIENIIQGQKLIRVYDGKTAWWINPFMGITEPRVLPVEQSKDLIEQADIDGSLVDYKKKGHLVELMGVENLEGSEVYKLKVTLKNGNKRFVYLDAEYFLEIKIGTKVKRQDVEIEISNYISDYKKVDGIVLPHSYETRIGEKIAEQIIVEKYEINAEIDDSVFKMPSKKIKKEE